MRSSKIYVGLLALLLASCGQSLGGKQKTDDPAQSSAVVSKTVNGSTLPILSGDNVLPFTVNGSLCSSNSYPNKPCVSVTICTPGTSTCQTINDILLDTGSYGLRLFKSTVTVSLSQVVTSGTSQNVAECVKFGDGSADWGPIQMADVVLGAEPAVQVPIHVIDSTFPGSSGICNGAETGPSEAGFNGILGVGLFVEDCGSPCATRANNGMYYACTGSSCVGTTLAGAYQVQNPVAHLPTDNNGVVLELPSISLGGAPSVNGYLVLGIGTRSNNIPSGVTTFSADPAKGEFTTQFNGSSSTSFIDSGSNGYFFDPTSQLPDCASTHSSLASWFCPSAVVSLSASNQAFSGSPIVSVPFQIGNFYNLVTSANNVYVESGADGGGGFVWGLPFYLGRNVYHGFEGSSSSLGSGTYWAY